MFVTRYLERRLLAFQTCPERHVHQIAAHERLLALARAAGDRDSYRRELAARGLELAVLQAEWLDRHRNLADLYAALGDADLGRAALARFRAAGERDFLVASAAVERTLAGELAATLARRAALVPLLVSLLGWRLAGERTRRAIRLRDVHGLWAVVQAGDPERTWEQLCSEAPYRRRLPFDDAGLALLGGWLAGALACPLPDERSPRAGDLATPDDRDPRDSPTLEEPDASLESAESISPAEPVPPGPARAYRLAYAAQDFHGRAFTRRAYLQIFALEADVAALDPRDRDDAFLWRMAEADLLDALARASQLDHADALRLHAANRSQPVMTQFAAALAATASAAPTTTVIELERARLDAWFEIESAWDELLVHHALAPVTAVLAAGGPGRAAAIREAASATSTLFGTAWDRVLASPRIWDFFARELVPAMFGRRPELGARAGETGVALVHAASESAHHPASAAPADVRDHLVALVRAAGALASPPAGARSLVLWDRPVALDAVLQHLAAPVRPDLASARG